MKLESLCGEIIAQIARCHATSASIINLYKSGNALLNSKIGYWVDEIDLEDQQAGSTSRYPKILLPLTYHKLITLAYESDNYTEAMSTQLLEVWPRSAILHPPWEDRKEFFRAKTSREYCTTFPDPRVTIALKPPKKKKGLSGALSSLFKRK